MAITMPLRRIDPKMIRPNPENPRLIFHEEEMTELLESIKQVGIKVPLAVYEDGSHFILLDGERRWRCSKKLNLSDVPVLIQPKPNRLENLLMMFNIHNVRVDWDPLPMALKLKDIKELMEKDGKDTSIKSLSAVTGVRPATVKRAFELLDLPKEYQDLLMKEAQKPRRDQKIKIDLFFEVFKSFASVERHAPEVLKEVNKKEYVKSMVDKYIAGTVDNVVSYREISKIARSEVAGVSKKMAIPTIIKLVKVKSYGIKQAYEDTVKSAFDQRDLLGKVNSITEKLSSIKSLKSSSEELKDSLKQLREEITRLLKG